MMSTTMCYCFVLGVSLEFTALHPSGFVHISRADRSALSTAVPRRQRFTLFARCHIVNTVHSAVARFLLPDQSSGARFQTNWERTLKTVVLGSHWKHCFSGSTSVPSALEVYLYVLYKSTFTYLLTLLPMWNGTHIDAGTSAIVHD